MDIDLSFPEDVWITVQHHPKANRGWCIIKYSIIKAVPSIIGAASYEEMNDGLLHYALKDMIQEKLPEGEYLVLGIRAEHPNPENWLFDDEAHLSYLKIMPAIKD